ncbi:isochorismatase family cysteine hydrolase [Acidaminobacter hydrogenoformans]|uniref:Nicotinamidase-related amidase n=1 Tax=Acidaminobacter hydrogenoformans DSM 2784 TaxID=1120920 RepID=A0A1G5S043_9FIRM|nr:isochorismatase family cysteine hydrolase [Acidaminobacter hydrogenoformans]SCZ79350.1 Nicotinamidase-related amidase [Acidaminobacter hydrogenoformans DSM 2784]
MPIDAMLPQQTALNESAKRWVNARQSHLDELPPLPLEALNPKTSVLVIIDMTNGFAFEGPLSSPRVGALVPVIKDLAKACLNKGIPVIAPSDHHTLQAEEFSAYPPHCVSNTEESELVSPLKALSGILTLPKNSTQIWHAPAFQAWFKENENRSTWLLTGDCTDICVLQFALALKTYYQSENKPSRIIVPVNAVNTFDTPDHPGDLYHLIGLDLMAAGGVELVRRVN